MAVRVAESYRGDEWVGLEEESERLADTAYAQNDRLVLHRTSYSPSSIITPDDWAHHITSDASECHLIAASDPLAQDCPSRRPIFLS